ncbi:MAG: 5-formyltetrahydrofolate cyclo-ligase [Desulfobulbaceae bacterium]|nr:5-formyltetrahydrofolate cyclo-ligase [Desulfobulbaceae bacterium]
MPGRLLSESDEIVQKRAQLRAWARQRRDSLALQKRLCASRRICQSVCSLADIRAATNIFVYCSFRSEVATDKICRTLLKMKKTVCVPLVVPAKKELLPIVLDKQFEANSCLRPGYQGIPEPVWETSKIFASECLDAVLLPGLLFDRDGNRLGYGGGFYDRFLAHKAPQALRIGLAFFCQLIASMPVLAHDMRLDILVTEQGILRWPRKFVAR